MVVWFLREGIGLELIWQTRASDGRDAWSAGSGERSIADVWKARSGKVGKLSMVVRKERWIEPRGRRGFAQRGRWRHTTCRTASETDAALICSADTSAISFHPLLPHLQPSHQATTIVFPNCNISELYTPSSYAFASSAFPAFPMTGIPLAGVAYRVSVLRDPRWCLSSAEAVPRRMVLEVC